MAHTKFRSDIAMEAQPLCVWVAQILFKVLLYVTPAASLSKKPWQSRYVAFLLFVVAMNSEGNTLFTPRYQRPGSALKVSTVNSAIMRRF